MNLATSRENVEIGVNALIQNLIEKIVIEIINKNKVHSPDFLFDRKNFLRENIFI